MQRMGLFEGDLATAIIFKAAGQMLQADVSAGNNTDGQFVVVLDPSQFLAFSVVEEVSDAVMDLDDDSGDFFGARGCQNQTHDLDGNAL